MIILALAIGWGIYSLIVSFEIFSVFRHTPKRSVSGAESLIGCKAKVLVPFERSYHGGKMSGRVFVNGEDWLADLSENCQTVPDRGADVTIVDVDTSTLRLSVR